VDASFLQQIEEHGGTYCENGLPKDALQIFKNHGVNFVRLRIWHTPASGYDDLAHTLAMAKRVKSLGLGLLVDVHYSDAWADPGHQTKPAAWASLTFDRLKKAVHDYTSEVITALKHQNTLPDIVQVGNEITSGFLWDDGRVGGAYDANWPRFAALLRAAMGGVEDALSGDQHGFRARESSRRGAGVGAFPTDDHIAIMLHVDAGGNNATCRWFFDNVLSQKVPFDLIGLSYYPWWHGSLRDFEDNLNDLAKRYGKKIVVVETAYPWTLDWQDGTANLVGEKNQLLPDFPATVEGQREFLMKEKSIIENMPCSRGAGMFYWAPEYISVPGVESVWENVTLFDFRGRALSSLAAFADSGASPSLPVRGKAGVKQKR
jgi:arabinogalactan endo-1,4-beta-galactosidase